MTSPEAPEPADEAAAPLPSEPAPSSSAALAPDAAALTHEVPVMPDAAPDEPGAEPPVAEADGSAAAAAAQPPVPEGPAPHAWPPVSAGPYRTPPYEATPYVARGPRPAWAVMGPSLRVFAVLLWSYVVVGQFTASWPLGRPISPVVALALVVLLTLLAWVAALRTSHAVAPAAGALRFVARGLALATVGFALFFFAVVAPMVGAVLMPHMRGYDLLVGFVLVSVSLGAALLGEHISYSPDLPRPARTHGQRFVLVVMWVAGALLTLVAGADLAGGL